VHADFGTLLKVDADPQRLSPSAFQIAPTIPSCILLTGPNYMEEKEHKKGDHTWLQRLNYAWEPLRSSLTIRIFGAASVFALCDIILKLHESAIKAGWINEHAVTWAMVAYGFLFLFTIRSLFLVAEEAGIHRETTNKLLKQGEAYGEVYRCLHSVIHETRDCLLSDGAFRKLLLLDDEKHLQHLYDTIQRQLGMMEKALRSLSGSDCSIVLKILKSAAPNKEASFVSCCYGPGTSLERRKESTILPANQGIAYQSLITKTICFSNDVKTDQRFWPQQMRDHYAQNRYQTVVVCPVITNKTVCGMLCFDWKEPGMYCKDYEQLLACFTDVVSLACYICHESRNVTPKMANVHGN
jgi:GAF domain-containing protein